MAPVENLVLAFQEILTVIVRVRSNRPVARSADVFRAELRGLLRQAEQQAIAQGYSRDDARLACFAVVALLDESLHVSTDPIFSDWKRMPLQQELFKTGNAGEEFFKGLEVLLKSRDTPQLADLLEVYYLCLLLGFQGRGSAESLRSGKHVLAERIGRMRGAAQPLCTSWAPGGGPIWVRGADLWVRRLMVAAAVCFLLALGLFIGYELILNSAVNSVSAAVSTASP